VLYADFHAKWVTDSEKYILQLGIGSGAEGFVNQCEAWEYLASRS
jgi:hypothetical protein